MSAVTLFDPEVDEVEVDSTFLLEGIESGGWEVERDPLELTQELVNINMGEEKTDAWELPVLSSERYSDISASNSSNVINSIAMHPKEIVISASNNSTNPYKSMEEFHSEMEKNIEDIVKECITFLMMDPREYHPFYLRVFKYISLGQQLGYIEPSSMPASTIWLLYDKFARELFERSKTRIPRNPILKGEVTLHDLYFDETSDPQRFCASEAKAR